MTLDRNTLLRQLPKVDEVLRRPDVQAVGAPHWAVVEAVRREVDSLRQAILDGRSQAVEITADEVARRAAALAAPSLCGVINATGVVLHTNLGRAPLADEVITRVAERARGYSNLEFQVDRGERGERHGHVSRLACELTGAEEAIAVNNNAAAVLLGLAALAGGREVIVSRGELIEIGGSFRVPDVMKMSGARLVEVGTTNKTHARDYEDAIGAETALLLKVHRSNFAVVGFTAEVELAELVAIGRRRNLPTMVDLGSGCLLEAHELAELGLPAEPSVRATVAAGADLVTFSGDKLLGGPQAGILAGSRAAVAACKAHPVMRALRPDKLTIAAIEATLAIYRDGRARRDIPTVAMLAATPAVLRARADALAQRLGPLPGGLRAEVVDCESAVGGGALPTAVLPSRAIALTSDRLGADAIDVRLRAHDPPVVARIHDAQVLVDVRTVADTELDAVAAAIRAVAAI